MIMRFTVKKKTMLFFYRGFDGKGAVHKLVKDSVVKTFSLNRFFFLYKVVIVSKNLTNAPGQNEVDCCYALGLKIFASEF